MGALLAAGLFLAATTGVFAVCLRLGILLGLRLDRALETQASRESGAGEEVGGDD